MYPYHYVKQPQSGQRSLTVFMPDGPPIVATAEHPHFEEILDGARADLDAADLRALADLSIAVAERFESLSERVSVANGRVYFDGDEVDSTITRQIIRCLEDPESGDWQPLVRFMENVAANPNEHSRTQLFDWLRDRQFTITSDGCFIAYKGVSDRESDDDEYVWESSGRGSAIVNGEQFEGRIPNAVGAIIEMPRSDVQHDPNHGCSTGLHVGTYEYATHYANAALLTVLVNPRDVVSVPTDCNAEKMRVCRYAVQDDEATHPSESPAIAAAPEGEGREPDRLYPAAGGGPDYDAYYVATGEFRPPREGEFRLDYGTALRAYCPSDMYTEPKTILVPTEPQHGDEKVDRDDKVWFWRDCSGETGWRAANGRDQEEFLANHENCEA